MSTRSFKLRVSAALVARIEELLRRTGRTPNPTAIESAAHLLLAGAVEEASFVPDAWLGVKEQS